MNETDHDLLIAIANDSKWIKEWALNHEKFDAANNAELKGIAKAAHTRIDKVNERFNWLITSSVLTIIFFSITLWFKK